MNRTLVILVVGLSPHLLGPHTPHLSRLAARGGMRHLTSVTPAVTCTVQATLATGLLPREHGVVANGWYFRDLREVLLWRQPENLVAGENIWEAGKARDAAFTCAKMFWWYNMYSSADFSATPRPMYPADGRKLPDHYAYPPELHDELNARLGTFPLFKFWGPLADITSSDWIAKATLHVMETRTPTLTLTYLPHLDYNLQRLGPDLGHPRLQQDLAEVDALCGTLIEAAERDGQRFIVVSEYGITRATDAVHINRALRRAGLLAVRPEEHGREAFDAGASAAFAMADHQIAHIYVRDPGRIGEVARLVADLEGVESVWDEAGKRANGLDHPRSGELVAVSEADRWFSYYYWLDDANAPDFARTVDIHRKPGYDPVELFMDPAMRAPKLAAAWKLAKRKLGYRQLLDVISLKDTQLVKGTHGRLTDDPNEGPLVISSAPELLSAGPVRATDFKRLVLDHVFD
ncbi:alkaline phosphatase family protein [Aurantimonas sp. C2-6-R+9]|uniref:alkaline phosphatase family protein n=1 Tax=unclassified Aurantimonas TaxID=2638230 RepID=UPI002E17CC90|nr:MULTISPECIES: alkaline phosphatase family protein [unclassified Aurantimonas]MEC5292273.1 alkaline phosphatase family protein [Aurantimonas sp. C2-3-R2]MEC5382488.1 alkaline phosphatase family protein [Aurantimonas sp. C2-6-R+9]MEC5413358.1 alkaline phosphatase family protein [Aurantimonas sp. C2-4-R8]